MTPCVDAWGTDSRGVRIARAYKRGGDGPIVEGPVLIFVETGYTEIPIFKKL